MINKAGQTFWNRGFIQGQDYRQLTDDDLDKLLEHVKNRKTALDIGCGTGFLARQLAKSGFRVTGIDISDVAIDIAKTKSVNNITYKVMDIESDNLSQIGKFDLVVCKLVVAFLADKNKFLSQASQLFNPGGLFVLIAPVVDNPELSDARLKAISVDEKEITESLKINFDKVKVSKKKLSPAHSWLTAIASN